MKKLSVDDLLSNHAYEAQRPALRQAMLEHKKTRRVALGPNATLHFEDYMTMRHQVQELIRSEKITQAGDIQEELSVYNPLIPDGQNLKATFMIEFSDEKERRQQLARLIGIENQIFITVAGCPPVKPIANEDLQRSTEDKTSAVHFMRYEFPPATVAAAKAGAAWTMHCEHANYRHKADIPEAIRASLTRDFD
jgi:hypothetical protein